MSVGAAVAEPGLLRALVVDDEIPACEELTFLLGRDARVGAIRTAHTAGEALRLLGSEGFDVLFCDVRMPGLDGVEFARVVSRFAVRPQIVFVTAYDDQAVAAFELRATDYVMKPVRAERLAEAVRRVVTVEAADTASDEDETITVELGGVFRFVRRSQVRFVEAHGDYVRLHTADGQHLLRVTLTELEERWSGAGFVRIHRSTLVALDHVDEIRQVDGHFSVCLGPHVLPVSRRHTRDLRDRLERR